MEGELKFITELHARRTDLIRARFMSRHSSNKSCVATIQFNIDTEWPIRSWFCICISGWWDVGCCAHMATLLPYLGVSQAGDPNKLHMLSASQFLACIDDSMQLSDIDDSDDNLESSEVDCTTDTDDRKDSEGVVIWDTLCKILLYSNCLSHLSNMYLVYKCRAADHSRANKTKTHQLVICIRK